MHPVAFGLVAPSEDRRLDLLVVRNGKMVGIVRSGGLVRLRREMHSLATVQDGAEPLEQDRFRLNHLALPATWRLKRESCSTS
jgi:hypothetical protein